MSACRRMCQFLLETTTSQAVPPNLGLFTAVELP